MILSLILKQNGRYREVWVDTKDEVQVKGLLGSLKGCTVEHVEVEHPDCEVFSSGYVPNEFGGIVNNDDVPF